MPRHLRLFIPGTTYHVYCRVARGEFVFDDDLEAIEFVETLREVRDLDGWTVLAWCLMGNHYRLVVKTRTVDLWRSMARLNESASGRDLDILASRHRSTMHVTGRIEFCVLDVSRYQLKACEIAALLGKSRNSITRWLNLGLCQERDDPEFAARLNALDPAISRR